MCDVCNNESCTVDVGVAAIPGAPMSIMWGDKCLRNPVGIVVPAWVLEYWHNENGDQVADWVKDLWTWHKGVYMRYEDFIRNLPTGGK